MTMPPASNCDPIDHGISGCSDVMGNTVDGSRSPRRGHLQQPTVSSSRPSLTPARLSSSGSRDSHALLTPQSLSSPNAYPDSYASPSSVDSRVNSARVARLLFTPESSSAQQQTSASAEEQQHEQGDGDEKQTSEALDYSADDPNPSKYDPDADVVTILPTPAPAPASSADGLLAAMRALPVTRPLISGLDPPAGSSSSSPHDRLCRIERIDAATLESVLRLCREYVREDVQAVLAEQRRLTAELDRLPAAFERVELSMRETREELQRLMAEAAAVADMRPALHRLYSDVNRAATSAQQLRSLLPHAAPASPQPAG